MEVQTGSFDGWSEEEVNAYMTAIISIVEKIEKTLASTGRS